MQAQTGSRQNVLLAVTSVLTILFTTLHLTDDYVRGMSVGDLSSYPVLPVLAIWLYGTLMLLGRRSGYIIVLVLSLLASGLPVVHMNGEAGLTAGIKSTGGFFFTWTLIALGVTAIFSVMLSVRGLRSLRQGQAR